MLTPSSGEEGSSMVDLLDGACRSFFLLMRGEVLLLEGVVMGVASPCAVLILEVGAFAVTACRFLTIMLCGLLGNGGGDSGEAYGN